MESYIQSAWNIIMSIVSFMKDTVILTVGGNQVTFLGLLIVTMVVNFLLWVIYELLGLVIDLA